MGGSFTRPHQITKRQEFDNQTVFLFRLNLSKQTGSLLKNDLGQCPLLEEVVKIRMIKRPLKEGIF